MRWFTTGVALATLLAWGTPGRAQTIIGGSLQAPGTEVKTVPIPVTLTIGEFAEVTLDGFATDLVVTQPGVPAFATMPGTLRINRACNMAVLAEDIIVPRTDGGMDRWGMGATFTAPPGVGNKTDIISGASDDACWWDITATVTDTAVGSTTVFSDSFLTLGSLEIANVPLGIYNLTFAAEFVTNSYYDATALAGTVDTDVTVTISPN